MHQPRIDFSALPVDPAHTPRLLNSKLNRFERMHNLPVVNSRPLRMGLDLSRVCNARCIFCLAEEGRTTAKDPEAFAPAGWLEHVESLLPFVEVAILSSYEAILNPWLDRHVDMLAKHHTPFQVFSNGKGLTPELSGYLLRQGMVSLWCSFHGAREETHRSIMRGVEYQKVLENLMNLKLLARRHPRFHLTMVFCAMDRNIDELPEYVDLAHSVGASAVQVNYLLVTQRAHGEDHDLDRESVFFHQERYDVAVARAKRKAARLGIALNHQPLFRDPATLEAMRAAACGEDPTAPCPRPWEHMNVDRDGNILICCGGSPIMGNIFEEDFFKVWNGPKLRGFRASVNSPAPPAACRRCTRGRENPLDIRTHLTYLRSMDEESVRDKLTRLRDYMPGRARITLPRPRKPRSACASSA